MEPPTLRASRTHRANECNLDAAVSIENEVFSFPALERGHAVFHRPDAVPYGMSETMRHFLGGLIKGIRELAFFIAPFINSYKRYASLSWAPAAPDPAAAARSRSDRTSPTSSSAGARTVPQARGSAPEAKGLSRFRGCARSEARSSSSPRGLAKCPAPSVSRDRARPSTAMRRPSAERSSRIACGSSQQHR